MAVRFTSDNLGRILNKIAVVWSRHRTGTSGTRWGKPRGACVRIANDPAEIRIRHLRIKVYSFPATSVSAVLPNILIVRAIGLQKSHVCDIFFKHVLYSGDVMWACTGWRMRHASTSTLTFTLPSDISYVFLSMALEVSYSKFNRHVRMTI